MSALLVITNVPDQTIAETIVKELIARKVAACVSVMAPCTSVYRWKGNIETVAEIPLFIKTRSERYKQVEAVIKANHPYELPEIIAVNIEQGLPPYLHWIGLETGTVRT